MSRGRTGNVLAVRPVGHESRILASDLWAVHIGSAESAVLQGYIDLRRCLVSPRLAQRPIAKGKELTFFSKMSVGSSVMVRSVLAPGVGKGRGRMVRKIGD